MPRHPSATRCLNCPRCRWRSPNTRYSTATVGTAMRSAKANCPTGTQRPDGAAVAQPYRRARGKYHLSVRKIQSLLRDQYGMTFSVGAISEAQGGSARC